MQRGDLSSLKALVAFGANVSICNNFSQTPLDIANMMGKNDLVKFLKEVGGLEGKALNSVNNPPRHPIQEQHERMEDNGEDQMRGEMGLAGKNSHASLISGFQVFLADGSWYPLNRISRIQPSLVQL